MNNYKKAQLGQTVSMILIVAGAIVLFLFVAKFSKGSTYEQSINSCRFSVLAQSSTEITPGITGKTSPFNINCDKRYVTFKDTSTLLGLNPENLKPLSVIYSGRKTTKYKTLTESVVNQVIAEEMRICKYQFTDGKIEIFVNDDPFWGSQNVCFICTEINFDVEGTKEFKTYLEYTKKAKFKSSEQTYYDYLTEKTFKDNSMWIQGELANNIQSMDANEVYKQVSKDYLNLNLNSEKKYFVVMQKSESGKIALNTILQSEIIVTGPNTAANIAPNVIVSPYLSRKSTIISLIPANDIGTYCSYQAS